jgi:methyl-accepting chemotaxis protein
MMGKKMNNWSIKKKLIMLCSLLLVLISGLGGLQVFGSKRLEAKLLNLSRVQLPAVRNMTLTDMMHDGLRAVVYHAFFAGDSSDQAAKVEIAEELKEFSSNITLYMKNIDSLDVQPDTRAAIDAAKPEVEAYVASTEEVVGLVLSGQRNAAIAKLPAFEEEFKKLEEKLGKLGELIEKDSEKSSAEGESLAAENNLIGLVFCLAGLLFGTSLSIWIVRNLMCTLGGIVEQLAHSNRDVSNARVAQGESSSKQLSDAATGQAASLQETMTAINEISAMVSQNADSAIRVKLAVEGNEEATQAGSESVVEVLRAIDEIKSTNNEVLAQLENSTREFGEIVKIITNIGEKTKVINDIVFQTKLLSFNASVEAARAGEHGKGFSVVAEEVGSLALMSGNAAKEITDMLTTSVNRVNAIVQETSRRVGQLVEKGKDTINAGESTAQRCQGFLEKISASAKETVSMITEISSATKEQALGIEEINKAICQLDQVTQQNTSVAQQCSTQAEQLNSQAQSLSQAVEGLVQLTGVAA